MEEKNTAPSSIVATKKSPLGLIIGIAAVVIILIIGGFAAYSVLFAKDRISNFNSSDALLDDESEDDEESIENEEYSGTPDEKLIGWYKWNEGDSNFYIYAKKGDVLREIDISSHSIIFVDWIDDDHFAYQQDTDDYSSTEIKVYDWSTDTIETVYTTTAVGQILADFVSPNLFVYKKMEEVLGEDGYNNETSYWMVDMEADYSLSADVKTSMRYGREGILYDSIEIKLSPDKEYFFEIDTGPSSNTGDASAYFVDVYDLEHDDGMYWADYVTTISSATYPFWRDNNSIAYFGNPSDRVLKQYDIDTAVTTEIGSLSADPYGFSYNPATDMLLYSSEGFMSYNTDSYVFDLDTGTNTLISSSESYIWASDNTAIKEIRTACDPADCGLSDYEVSGSSLVGYPGFADIEALVSGYAQFITAY